MTLLKSGLNIAPVNGIEQRVLVHPKGVGFRCVVLIVLVILVVFKECAANEVLLC